MPPLNLLFSIQDRRKILHLRFFYLFQLQFKVVHEKPVSVAIATESDDDIQFIVAQIIALLRHNFPGSSRGYGFHLLIG